jgi:hypothetical protein
MKQRTILLSTGSSDPSLGAGTAYFWVGDLSLSNWGDWKYANSNLERVDLNRVWSVRLCNEKSYEVRIVPQED